MDRPLDGYRVALAEGRQLDELADLLSAEGALPLRHPLVSMLDAVDQGPIVAWLENLATGGMDLVVFFTGEGVQRLLAAAERQGLHPSIVEALGKTSILTRGPKPVRALKAIGVIPEYVAAPPTTEGVIATLQPLALQGRTVGVQLYGSDNPALESFLRARGATMEPVTPYTYAPASDALLVINLVAGMADGAIDAICFTSSPQVVRLVQVATEHSLLPMLAAGMNKVCVAAVGPVVAATLIEHHFRVDVCPQQGFVMKNLVLQLKRFRATQSGQSS